MISILKVLVSILSLAAIISTSFAYESTLYDYSLETAIPSIQMNAEGSQLGWKIFSDGSLALLPAITIVITFMIVS